MSTRNRIVVSAVAGALACALVGVVTPATSAPQNPAATRPRDPDGHRLGPLQRHALRERGTVLRTPGQTSDGVRGQIAAPLSKSARGRPPVVTSDVSYQIAPGIVVREWDQRDARGPVRANLVTVDLNTPGLSLDYLGSPYLVRREPVSQLATETGALVAINGDFFDIDDTGAALGVNKSRTGIVQGSATGWIPENMSFFVTADGTPRIGALATRTKLRQRPRWPISGVNPPKVAADSIGVYTSAWGWTKGYSVTEADKRTREVVVNNGRVVSNRVKLSKGRKVKGQVMVARGRATRLLKQLKVGSRASFKYRITPGVQMAVSGDRPLIVDGVTRVVDNTLMHPRTAIGIDATGTKLLFLTVDGRSAASRGLTMVELAALMGSLGAVNALNFDGGGSSTMFTRNPTGAMAVINEPSDGTERNVANGLGLFYAGVLPPVTPAIPTPPPPTPTPTPPTTPPPTPTPTPPPPRG